MIVRFLVKAFLVVLMFLPAFAFGFAALNSIRMVNAAGEELTDLRLSIGKTTRAIQQVKNDVKRLNSAANNKWQSGQAESQIISAFAAGGVSVMSIGTPEYSIDEPNQNASKILIRGRGSIKNAKEVLWNLGDLGPTVRLDYFRGEYDSASRSIIWSYLVRIEGLSIVALEGTQGLVTR